ncbi:50S ribosomal protein L29 [Mycoplasma sp. CAG:776]|nr:50S ribosomal protein L29 [Mycoplasma sp. CAG:776]
MKIKDLRELSDKELESKIIETKKELFNLRMKQSTGTLEKPSKIRELRKDVARMKTILKERELAGGNTDGE